MQLAGWLAGLVLQCPAQRSAGVCGPHNAWCADKTTRSVLDEAGACCASAVCDRLQCLLGQLSKTGVTPCHMQLVLCGLISPAAALLDRPGVLNAAKICHIVEAPSVTFLRCRSAQLRAHMSWGHPYTALPRLLFVIEWFSTLDSCDCLLARSWVDSLQTAVSCRH